MKSHEKPYILHVAEKIYLEVAKIRRENKDFSITNSINSFIGSEIYKEISNGKFHDNWFEKLEKNNFVDEITGKKITKVVEKIKVL